LFLNYLTRPYKSAKYVKPLDTPFDFANRRALLRRGGDDDYITFTTAQDLANVVAKAVEFEGEWPVEGGITGTKLSVRELIALGEDIRGMFEHVLCSEYHTNDPGGAFKVEHFTTEELECGNYKASWLPTLDHPTILPEDVEAASKTIVSELLLALAEKAFETGDEWNRLLPGYEFTGAEEFLREAWRGKP
tara:strand:- start:11558 stop:12130 length:573 start_codon:yes stop_codon:yes gene_type:complete